MRFNFPHFDSFNPSIYCVSSGRLCRFSGHNYSSTSDSFVFGNLLGFISVPIIFLILLGYFSKSGS